MPPGRAASARRGALIPTAPTATVAAALGSAAAAQGAGAADLLPGGWHGLTLAVAVGVFVVVEALLIVAALRLRRPAALAADASRFRLSWRWELLWTVLPALGLLALGLWSVQALRDDRPAPPHGATPTPVAVTAPADLAHADPTRQTGRG